MYSIYADDICIYDDVSTLKEYKVSSPVLELEDSAAGSLSFKLPVTNIGYYYVQRLTTDIVVKKDNVEIWAGRVISEDKDFWKNRSLYCEGELAFLNDTTQPQAEYHNMTVRGFLTTLISIHNAKVPENRRFTVGVVTVTDSNDSLYRYTNYEKTIECINDKLVNRLGGHIRVRKQNGIRYIDYLADYPNTNSQVIEFGKNLIDLTQKWDLTEFATVILPLGARLDESPIEALDAYLTVESVNGGSKYVQSDEAVSQYGWIEKVVNWDDVTTASTLLSKARAYLSDIQFDNMEIELSAMDLHYMNVNYEDIKLLDNVRAVSWAHGMDRYFPVTKLKIPLDSPEKTHFKLGDTVRTSLTSINNATNTKILQAIENLPTKQVILDEAKANATAIMNLATNGYITITQDANGSNELYISNTRDYTKATKFWKWNMNGLGYSGDGGQTYDVAITMDGAIVADYITSGTMSADRIRGGVIESTNYVAGTSGMRISLVNGTITTKNFSLSSTGVITATNVNLTGSIKTDVNSGYYTHLENGAMKVYLDSKLCGYIMPVTGSATQFAILGSANYGGVAIGASYSGDTINTYYRMNIQGAYTDDGCRHHFIGTVKFDDNIKSDMQFDDHLGLKFNSKIAIRYATSDDGVARDGLWIGSSNMSTILNGNRVYVYSALRLYNSLDFFSSSGNAYQTAMYWDYSNRAFNVGNTAEGLVLNAGGSKGYNGIRFNGRVRSDIDFQNGNGISLGGDIAFRWATASGQGVARDGLWIGMSNYRTCIVGNHIHMDGIVENHNYLDLENGYGIRCNGYIAFRWNTSSLYCGIDTSPLRLVGSNIYANGSPVSTSSDSRKKNSITDLSNKYLELIKAIRPVSFKYNEDISLSGRTHTGFIAQEVKNAMDAVGLTTGEFAAFVDLNGDGEEYALRYEEFISPLLMYVQHLENRIKILEERAS